jgi:hypothetical protein
MPSINTSYHLNTGEIPKISIDTHYVIDKDGIETENLNFHVLKIETIQGESNYFLRTDEQLSEFINNLKALISQRDRISAHN